jgi:hypothetical protein
VKPLHRILTDRSGAGSPSLSEPGDEYSTHFDDGNLGHSFLSFSSMINERVVSFLYIDEPLAGPSPVAVLARFRSLKSQEPNVSASERIQTMNSLALALKRDTRLCMELQLDEAIAWFELVSSS